MYIYGKFYYINKEHRQNIQNYKKEKKIEIKKNCLYKNIKIELRVKMF